MKLRKYIPFIILAAGSLILATCQAETPASITEADPHPSSSAATLPAPPTPTKPTPAITPTLSPSPEPTATKHIIDALPGCPSQPFRLPASSQTSAPISTENAGQVACLGRWGTGVIYEVDYSPDGERLAVKSALGITLYEAEYLQQIAFLEIPSDERLGAILQPGMTNLMGFASGGEILAAAVSDKVALYQASDGSPLDTLEGTGENAPLMTLAFSRDGKLVAASEGWTGDVNIWDVEDRELLQSWQDAAPTTELSFSPDGQLLVSSNGQVRDVYDGSILFDLGIEGCCLNEVNFSPDGKYMTAVWDQDGILKMWRMENGELLHSFDGYGKTLFSPDGAQLTVISPSFVVQIVSTADGELISSYTYENPEFASQYILGFSQNGTRLVTAAFQGTVNIWEMTNGQLIQTLEGHRRHVSTAQFSPDGDILVTADDAWVRTWRMSDGSPLETRQHAYPSVILSPDGSTLVTDLNYWEGMQMWDAGDGSLLYTLEDNRWPLAFSADGEMLATNERKISDAQYISDAVQIRSISDGTPLYQLNSDDNEFDNPNFYLDFSANGRYVAAVHDPGDILVWRIPDSEPLYRLSASDYPPFVILAISPEGGYLATGNSNHTVQIWGLESGELLQTLEMEATEIMGTSGAVSRLAFSPDGTLLSAVDEGGFYQIWQVSDWTTLQHASDFVNQYDLWGGGAGMAFSPDGTLLATAGTGGAISLWDVADGSLLVTLKGHVAGIRRVGFSPDGRWFYSVSLDGTVRFWGVPVE